MKNRPFQSFSGNRTPPASMTPERTEAEIEGEILSFTFQSEDGEYCVARVALDREDKAVVAVGALLGLSAGERVHFKGRWTVHSKYGEQFAVESFVPILPATLSALKSYLGSGLIPGMRERTAEKLLDHFGEDLPQIIEEAPERLSEVRGLRKKLAESLVETWRRQTGVRDLMIFLQGMGISPALGSRLYKHYGDETAQILRTNPYRAALEVRQVGFKTADQIARKMGIPSDSPRRAEAGVVHVLAEALGEGHTFLPAGALVHAAAEMLQIPEEAVAAALGRLKAEHKVEPQKIPGAEFAGDGGEEGDGNDGNDGSYGSDESDGSEAEESGPGALRESLDTAEAIFAPSIFACESGVAKSLENLLKNAAALPRVDVQSGIAAYEKLHDIELAPEQREAIERACSGGCVVVTGGPGTGKTTLIRAVIELLESAGVKISLCAPTGRAAQRLGEATLRNAATIHRLLKYSPDSGFGHNADNPLPADLLICDETSMVDIPLAFHLLRALPPTSAALFVGDVDQLPSVGPGNFLRDLIQSEKVAVIRLNRIFRQSRQSLIVVNAHRINQGQYPVIPKNFEQKPTPDFYFIEREDPEECLRLIKLLVHERIPARFNFHPIHDVQVLTPMRKGVLGVSRLNAELQGLLNPGHSGWRRGETLFKIGDKVMQQVNNYDLDVFNGDVGIIHSIDQETQRIAIRYGRRLIEYAPEQLEEIALAYACTIHKSQGSEYKAVVVPVHTQHYVMLQRNLIYTGLTRGKRLVCVIGTRKALWMAIQNDRIRERYSALRAWLVHGPPKGSIRREPIEEQWLPMD